MGDTNRNSCIERFLYHNLSSLFEFLPHWTPNKTHGKQNAPSRNFEYASQGNLFSQPHTKWRLEFEHSTDTGKSNSSPGFHAFSMNLSLSWSEYELISLKTKPISYWEQSSFRQTGSPRTMVYKSKYSCLREASLRIQQERRDFWGRGFSLYMIVSSLHGSLRPE